MSNFNLPGAERFAEYLENKIGMDLVAMGPEIITDEKILKKFNNTKLEVEGWIILDSEGNEVGHYATIGMNKKTDFGRMYEGKCGYNNPQLRKDEFILIYWNQDPLIGTNTQPIKLPNFQRIDGHDIPFP